MKRRCKVSSDCGNWAVHKIDDSSAKPEYRSDHHGQWSCLECVLVGYEVGDRLPVQLSPEHVSAMEYLSAEDLQRWQRLQIESSSEVAKLTEQVERMSEQVAQHNTQILSLSRVDQLVPFGLMRKACHPKMNLADMATRAARASAVLRRLDEGEATFKALHEYINTVYMKTAKNPLYNVLNWMESIGLIEVDRSGYPHRFNLTEAGGKAHAALSVYQDLMVTLDKTNTHESA